MPEKEACARARMQPAVLAGLEEALGVGRETEPAGLGVGRLGSVGRLASVGCSGPDRGFLGLRRRTSAHAAKLDAPFPGEGEEAPVSVAAAEIENQVGLHRDPAVVAAVDVVAAVLRVPARRMGDQRNAARRSPAPDGGIDALQAGLAAAVLQAGGVMQDHSGNSLVQTLERGLDRLPARVGIEFGAARDHDMRAVQRQRRGMAELRGAVRCRVMLAGQARMGRGAWPAGDRHGRVLAVPFLFRGLEIERGRPVGRAGQQFDPAHERERALVERRNGRGVAARLQRRVVGHAVHGLRGRLFGGGVEQANQTPGARRALVLQLRAVRIDQRERPEHACERYGGILASVVAGKLQLRERRRGFASEGGGPQLRAFLRLLLHRFAHARQRVRSRLPRAPGLKEGLRVDLGPEPLFGALHIEAAMPDQPGAFDGFAIAREGVVQRAAENVDLALYAFGLIGPEKLLVAGVVIGAGVRIALFLPFRLAGLQAAGQPCFQAPDMAAEIFDGVPQKAVAVRREKRLLGTEAPDDRGEQQIDADARGFDVAGFAPVIFAGARPGAGRQMVDDPGRAGSYAIGAVDVGHGSVSHTGR